jgi:hypothetical protein
MELANCGPKEAAEALAKHKEIWLAVDAIMTKPKTKGDAYIPAPPKVNTGMTPEQEERCRKGRWLQDQVNVVFSVAHSKTRSPLDAEGCSSASAPPASQTSVPAPPAVAPGS